MPAPTALLNNASESVNPTNPVPGPSGKTSQHTSQREPHTNLSAGDNGDDDIVLDMNDAPPTQPTDAEPTPSHHADPAPGRLVHIETRKVPVPPHRFSPIKAAWPKIYPPLCEHLQLQVRMNIKNKAVELRNSRVTTDPGALQKGEDFLRALTLGFDVDDAIALLRLDDLYVAVYLLVMREC